MRDADSAVSSTLPLWTYAWRVADLVDAGDGLLSPATDAQWQFPQAVKQDEESGLLTGLVGSVDVSLTDNCHQTHAFALSLWIQSRCM